MRRRDRFKPSTHHEPDNGGRSTSKNVKKVPKSGAVGTRSARMKRVNTAGTSGAFTGPRPPSKRASTAIPIVAASARGRSRRSGLARPSPSDRTMTAEAAVRRDHTRGDTESSAGDQRHAGALSSNPADAAVEQQRKSESSCRDAQAALAPASDESLDEAENIGHPTYVVASPQGSADESCSEESFDVYDGENDSLGASEWDSSTSSRSSSIGSDIEALSPASDKELPDQREEGTEENGGRKMEEEQEGRRGEDSGGDVPVQSNPAKDDRSKACKRSRQKRRDKEKTKMGRPEGGSTGLDDAWSNRWLTGKKYKILAICIASYCRGVGWRE